MLKPNANPLCVLNANGFCIPPFKLAEAECDELIERLQNSGSTGDRNLMDHQWCCELALHLQSALEASLPSLASMRPVQCTYFKKDESRNWLVSWHQDRSLPFDPEKTEIDKVVVREKQGAAFYQPCRSTLEKVISLRLHLDVSNNKNGPLRFLAATHRNGILDNSQIAMAKRETEESVPEIHRGGVLALKPLVLHASSKSTSSDPRRVLHFVYC